MTAKSSHVSFMGARGHHAVRHVALPFGDQEVVGALGPQGPMRALFELRGGRASVGAKVGGIPWCAYAWTWLEGILSTEGGFTDGPECAHCSATPNCSPLSLTGMQTGCFPTTRSICCPHLSPLQAYL